MKTKITALILAVSMLATLFVSCDDSNDDTSINIFSVFASSDVLEGSSECSQNFSAVESTVSDNGDTSSGGKIEIEELYIKNYEEYGYYVTEPKYNPGAYALRKKENDGYLYSLVLYDKVTKEFTLIDQATNTKSGKGFDDVYYGKDSEGFVYYNASEKEIGYYMFDSGEKGIIPVVDKSLTPTVFYTDRGANVDVEIENGRIYWKETSYIEGKEREAFYCYNIEKDKRKKIYENDGDLWIYSTFYTQDGIYMKLIPVAHCEYDDSMPGCITEGPGDVIFYDYDTERVETVIRDVFDFKVENEKLLIKERGYDDPWEEV